MSVYDLKRVNLPSLTGRPLRAFAAALENRVSGKALIGRLLKDAGMFKLRDTVLTEPPTNFPLAIAEAQQLAGQVAPVDLEQLVAETEANLPTNSPSATILDFAIAYRSGTTTPTEVAERLLAAIMASDEGATPLRAMLACDHADVRQQAAQALSLIHI